MRRRSHNRLRRLAMGLAFVMTGWTGFARTPQAVQEYDLKAAMLPHFISFVEWPGNAFASADAPYVIGILNVNPFGTALADVVRDRQFAGRDIELREWREDATDGDLHVLFVPRTETLSEDERNRLEARSVLIITETDTVSAKGAINLYLEDSKVRPEVSRQSVGRAGLDMSSQLLSLARLLDE